MERCPVCRARLKAATSCYRCGSELSGPLNIALRARALERQAVQALANNDATKARHCIEQALRLRRTPFAWILLGWIADHEKADQNL